MQDSPVLLDFFDVWLQFFHAVALRSSLVGDRGRHFCFIEKSVFAVKPVSGCGAMAGRALPMMAAENLSLGPFGFRY
jgi:hypothetical protein